MHEEAKADRSGSSNEAVDMHKNRRGGVVGGPAIEKHNGSVQAGHLLQRLSSSDSVCTSVASRIQFDDDRLLAMASRHRSTASVVAPKTTILLRKRIRSPR
jgi:hypothetical protein